MPPKDICMCGAKIGKHDAGLHCVPDTTWAGQLNRLIRRKVAVVPRPPKVERERVTNARLPLFDD